MHNYSHTAQQSWLRAKPGRVGGARCAGVKRASAFAPSPRRTRPTTRRRRACRIDKGGACEAQEGTEPDLLVDDSEAVFEHLLEQGRMKQGSGRVDNSGMHNSGIPAEDVSWPPCAFSPRASRSSRWAGPLDRS